MRGLASMKELKARTERTLLPCQVFDLICGTSVGGLISILLGRLGLDCALYMTFSPVRRREDLVVYAKTDEIKNVTFDELLL